MKSPVVVVSFCTDIHARCTTIYKPSLQEHSFRCENLDCAHHEVQFDAEKCGKCEQTITRILYDQRSKFTEQDHTSNNLAEQLKDFGIDDVETDMCELPNAGLEKWNILTEDSLKRMIKGGFTGECIKSVRHRLPLLLAWLTCSI
jgi:hypothetical protein